MAQGDENDMPVISAKTTFKSPNIETHSLGQNIERSNGGQKSSRSYAEDDTSMASQNKSQASSGGMVTI